MGISGQTAGGNPASQASQPNLIDFAFDVTDARLDVEPTESTISLPVGRSFDRDRNQILIEPPALSFSEFRAALGYIASTGDANSTDADSPFLLQIVTKIFPHYGFSADEASDSFAFARANAFSSNAFLGRRYTAVCPGMPVRGLLTPTDST